MQEIEIPEENDIDWQIEMLRKLSRIIENVKDMEIEDCAYEELLIAEAHVEALREYSGY